LAFIYSGVVADVHPPPISHSGSKSPKKVSKNFLFKNLKKVSGLDRSALDK